MVTQLKDPAVETSVREVLSGWQEAVVSGDVSRIMAFYTEDVMAFDAVIALRFIGRAAYQAHWEYCITLCPSDNFVFEVHEVDVTASNDLAFAHYLVRCGAANEKGEMETSWMRGTACFRKEAGEWRIAHEHFSAPFDPESMTIIQNAQP